jgi:hypothetical protein
VGRRRTHLQVPAAAHHSTTLHPRFSLAGILVLESFEGTKLCRSTDFPERPRPRTNGEQERGTTKHRWAENHDGYDHNQPRVPAGHPDGGQWTKTGTSSRRIGDIALDETPDEDWIPGADLAARGHHWMPREFYLRFPFTRETRKVFRDATSGTLPHRIYRRIALLNFGIASITHIDNTMPLSMSS